MNKIIKKVVLKHCTKITKSFYPEAILRDKEIIESGITEQEIINFLDNCEYLQKIEQVRCPDCCRVLSYYDVAELEEDDDIECPDCDYEFTFNDNCIEYYYRVLHDKVPQIESMKRLETNESERMTVLQKLPNIDMEKFKEDLMKDRRIGRQSLNAFLEILAKHGIQLN